MLNKLRVTLGFIITFSVVVVYLMVAQTFHVQQIEMGSLGLACLLFSWRYLVMLFHHLIKVF